ncbi:hypothetical protein B0H21DRAFT_729557 [Amylocystis lapponica]|nr:hypothetical protein B0H21DRAFT_729557 [Amylocystis lapponica]
MDPPPHEEQRARTPPPQQPPVPAQHPVPLVAGPAGAEPEIVEPVRENAQEGPVAPAAPGVLPVPARPPQDAQQPASAIAKAEKARESQGAVKTEKGLQPIEMSQASQSVPASQRSEDSFLVTIEYGDAPDDDNRMLFKTRGRHLVGKVLMQACRTFEIEQFFPRAWLVLIVEIAEDDEVVEHRFACAREETMAQVGAEPNCRFAVEIDEAR